MQSIYIVLIYTFEDWNTNKWFDTEADAQNYYEQLCAKDPEGKCFYKVKEVKNDQMGNNFRFYNISQNNKG